MLLAAIADDNPVMFIEHRWCYGISDDVPTMDYHTELDKARLLHTGTDVTIAAFSYMSLEALAAARALQTHVGVGADVIDMRSVRPLDIPTVLESVQKTGRLLVVDGGNRAGSIASEVVAQVVDRGFGYLKSAPRRITCPDHPAPTSHHLAIDYYPNAKHIIQGIAELTGIAHGSAPLITAMGAVPTSHRHDVPNREFLGPF
jgi:pyruvate dehydrogenase E1 component beta subunit